MGTIVDFELRRMIAARDATRAALGKIIESIRANAEHGVIFTVGAEYGFRRGTSNWTTNHERQYQEAVARLESIRAPETRALAAKLARQDAAIRRRIASRRTRTP